MDKRYVDPIQNISLKFPNKPTYLPLAHPEKMLNIFEALLSFIKTDFYHEDGHLANGTGCTPFTPTNKFYNINSFVIRYCKDTWKHIEPNAYTAVIAFEFFNLLQLEEQIMVYGIKCDFLQAERFIIKQFGKDIIINYLESAKRAYLNEIKTN